MLTDRFPSMLVVSTLSLPASDLEFRMDMVPPRIGKLEKGNCIVEDGSVGSE